MPTYDYVCLKCGREFEYNQPMTADRLERCIYEGCDGEVKRRIGSGLGIIFKGSGFYETDYKRKNGKTPTSKPNTQASSSSTEKKTESAPAAKSDSKKSDSSAPATTSQSK